MGLARYFFLKYVNVGVLSRRSKSFNICAGSQAPAWERAKAPALVVIHKSSCPPRTSSYRHGCRYPAPWTVTWRLYRYLSDAKFHLPVSGFRHPCQNDGVSRILVYNDESWSLGTSETFTTKARRTRSFALVPKLQLRESGSWSFQDCVPKLELGNERIRVLLSIR
jgi:hypothetical protein